MDSKFVSPTHVCAVDIGGTKIACGIVTLNGFDTPKVQSVKKVPTSMTFTPMPWVRLVTALATVKTAF